MANTRKTLSVLWIVGLFLVSTFTCAPTKVLGASPSSEEEATPMTKDIQVLPVNENSRTEIKVRITSDKQEVKPGDKVTVYFQTDKDAYLTLLDVGTSGKVTRLWPNQFSGAENRVQAGRTYQFPSATDRFQFTVSGPDGLERIVAIATSKPNRIISEREFAEGAGGFKPYAKEFKDLVVEASNRTSELTPDEQWGTAEARLRVGNVPPGGNLFSKNIYVLSIGASTEGLKYCDKDAIGFAEMVQKRFQIPSANIRVGTGQNATKQKFIEGLRWLARSTRPDDLAFVFFSGHGTQIPDQPPLDEADGLDEAFICWHEKSGLSMQTRNWKDYVLVDDEFAELMKSVPARRRIVVVDACHSGTIDKATPGRLVSKHYPMLPPHQLKDLQIDTSRSSTRPALAHYTDPKGLKETLAAACKDAEQSYEDQEKKGGLFTYWLLEYLRTGGGNLTAVFDKVQKRVLEETGPGMAPKPQTPQLTDQNELGRDLKF